MRAECTEKGLDCAQFFSYNYVEKTKKSIMVVKNGIKTIKLEDSPGISHSTTSKSRNKTHKAESFSWPFYRLKQFITYKAELLGIKVSLIDPYNTSKICPNCGQINKAKDRLYVCDCGYTGHRDLVGAKNILAAPIN